MTAEPSLGTSASQDALRPEDAGGWGIPMLAAFASACWWGPRAAPGVTFEDSGELVSAALDFGVPHPPGYPLWTWVTGGSWRVAELFVEVSAARWAALLSVFFGALTVLFLTRLARASGAGPLTTLVVGYALGASSAFSSQAVVPEVYTLAAAIQAALAWCALSPRPHPRGAWLCLGLGLAAHPATLFFAPLAPIASLRAPRGTGRFGGSHGLLLAAPLGLYALLPWQARREPFIRWGELESFDQWRDHVLRAQYLGDLGGELGPRIQFAVDTAGPLLPLGAGVGMASLLLSRAQAGARWSALFVLALVAAGTLASIGYDLDAVVTRLRLTGAVLPLVLASAIGLGLGLPHLKAGLGIYALVLGNAAVVALLWWIPQQGPHTEHQDFRHRRAAGQWAELALSECPPDALLIVNRLGFTDTLGFPLWHAQVAQELRRDVVVVSRALLDAPWYRAQLARRHPDLAPGLARIDAALEAVRPESLGPRERRLANGSFLAWAFEGPRPLVFSDPPGPKVLGARTLFPGGLLWHATEDMAPSGAEADAIELRWSEALESEPAEPWRSMFEELGGARARARAR